MLQQLKKEIFPPSPLNGKESKNKRQLTFLKTIRKYLLFRPKTQNYMNWSYVSVGVCARMLSSTSNAFIGLQNFQITRKTCLLNSAALLTQRFQGLRCKGCNSQSFLTKDLFNSTSLATWGSSGVSKEAKFFKKLTTYRFVRYFSAKIEQTFKNHPKWAFFGSVLDIFEDCSVLAEK